MYAKSPIFQLNIVQFIFPDDAKLSAVKLHCFCENLLLMHDLWSWKIEKKSWKCPGKVLEFVWADSTCKLCLIIVCLIIVQVSLNGNVTTTVWWVLKLIYLFGNQFCISILILLRGLTWDAMIPDFHFQYAMLVCSIQLY